MALCGASKVWTYDLEPLLSRVASGCCLEHSCEFARSDAVLRLARSGLLRLEEALGVVDRLPPEETLQRLGIEAQPWAMRAQRLQIVGPDFGRAAKRHPNRLGGIPASAHLEHREVFRLVRSLAEKCIQMPAAMAGPVATLSGVKFSERVTYC